MAEKHQAAAPGFFSLVLQQRLFERRWLRLLLLAAGCAAIPLWQRAFAVRHERLDRGYYQWASSGLQHPDGIQAPTKFVYFFTYLGLYPVASELDESQFEQSVEGGRRVLAEHGGTLVMETGHTIRSGEPGQILLYLPDVWLKGQPTEPSVRPCHGMAFTVALVALFVAFWWVRQPLLGVLIVAFLGSNPFQLYEVYRHENVFGWLITTGALLLALHLPLLGGRRAARAYVWALPVATGLLLATVRQVRPEPMAMLVSAALCYLAVSHMRWWARLALVALLGVSFLGASGAWEAHFERKYQQAHDVVRRAGGHPYTGPRLQYHLGWHNVWCGLGDFDTKYGYEWNDNTAKLWARPILSEEYGEIMPPWDETSLTCDAWWDAAKKYYKMPHELPHYEHVVRRKVLHDMTHDPLWYLDILLRRTWRILTETTPLRLSWGGQWATLPMHGLLVLPALGVLVWVRAWFLAKLVLFLVPTSFVALLVFSGGGTCYYSAFHLIVAAVVCALLFEGALWAYRWWRRQRRPA